MPTVVLPGMFSTTRRLTTERERARSRARLVICAAFTPAAGSTSKRVITGPGNTSTTRTSTLKSSSFFSSRRDILSSDCLENCGGRSLSTASNNDKVGNCAVAGISNSGACFSFSTRMLCCTRSITGSMRGAGCAASTFSSTATVSRRLRRARQPTSRSISADPK